MIPLHDLPRVVFVLGKGGVGRSTVATALGSTLARRGERVLVFEWALSEAIAPWFGLPPAGIEPVEVAPRLSVANFHLDDALRAFFVGHLGMGAFYRHVVHGRAVRSSKTSIELSPKLDAGTYGLSEASLRPIPFDGLQAVPWARYAVEEAEWIERAFGRKGHRPTAEYAR